MVVLRSAAEQSRPAGRRFVADLAMASALLVTTTGCATARVSRIEEARASALSLAREADAELERGCYLCLRSAATKYDAAVAGGASSMNLKAAGAWALVGARERELGLRPTDALDRARSHRIAPTQTTTSTGSQSAPTIVDGYIQIASILPWLFEGVSRESSAESARAAREAMAIPGPGPVSASLAAIRERVKAGDDLIADYLILSLECSGYEPVAKDIAAPVRSASGTRPQALSLLAF